MVEPTSSITPIYSILRIKRKRAGNQQPLDALVIGDSSPRSSKRRRHEDTPRGDSSRSILPSGSRGIFRFAETVPLDSFDTDNKARLVKERITAFLKHPPPPPLPQIGSSHSIRNLNAEKNASSPGRKLPSSLRAARLSFPSPKGVGGQFGGVSSSSGASPRRAVIDKNGTIVSAGGGGMTVAEDQQRLQGRVAVSNDHQKRARFRIVEEKRALGSSTSIEARSHGRLPSQGPLPPEVLNVADLKSSRQEEAGFLPRIYDAVEEESVSDVTPKSFDSPTVGSITSYEDQDMMDNFAPMLRDYLTLQDSTEQSFSAVRQRKSPVNDISILKSSPSSSAPNLKVPIDDPGASELYSQGEGNIEEDGEEFVYDVYYRDLRETPADINTGGGSGTDVGSMAGLKRIGELAGLDEDENLLSAELSSEEEDEADQDSNEENDYRNDYPDEEDDSDENELNESSSGGWSE